jgi:hypothetical protein
MCTEDQATTEQVNGPTFGAPVPLLSVAPVCLVSRFGSPKITAATANVQTGELTATVHLLSDVYITNAAQLCPRCSGSDIGKSGTCDSGARAGQSCRTEGIVTVSNVPGNKVFDLSSDCPPSGTPAGTLTVTLPATTGTSSLQGPKPCPGQTQDDACNGTPCNATCTNCASTVDGNCIDPKGGIKQTCCAGNTKVSCFPTANGGTLTRTGSASVPTPAWPDATYPKTGTGALVATFCEGATGTVLVDQPSGLPGPGAIILPASEVWSR